jgi:hypothetical protein
MPVPKEFHLLVQSILRLLASQYRQGNLGTAQPHFVREQRGKARASVLAHDECVEASVGLRKSSALEQMMCFRS